LGSVAASRSLVEGTTAAALRSTCAVTQVGFASGSFPQSRSTVSITNTLVGTIGQQSRPIARLGRHVMPRCAGPAGACSARPGSRKSADPSSGLLRRSPHGSGRSAPSRAAALSQSMPIPWRLFPLTARLAGRCPWRASRSKPARGRTYQPLTYEPYALLFAVPSPWGRS